MHRVLSVAVVLLLVVPTCLYAQCEPGFTVTKTADVEVSIVGECVEYTIVVENTGTCELTLAGVDDSLMGDLTAHFWSVLMVGATEARTFSHIVQPEDPDPLINTVTFTYTDPSGDTQMDMAAAVADLIHPSFTVSVHCLTPEVPPGEDAEFQVIIVNTGDVDLVINPDDPGLPDSFTLPTGDVFVHVTSVPCVDDQACYTIGVLATLPEEYGLPNQYAAGASDCCPCGVNPAEENTWGRVKSLFRSEAGD